MSSLEAMGRKMRKMAAAGAKARMAAAGAMARTTKPRVTDPKSKKERAVVETMAQLEERLAFYYYRHHLTPTPPSPEPLMDEEDICIDGRSRGRVISDLGWRVARTGVPGKYQIVDPRWPRKDPQLVAMARAGLPVGTDGVPFGGITAEGLAFVHANFDRFQVRRGTDGNLRVMDDDLRSFLVEKEVTDRAMEWMMNNPRQVIEDVLCVDVQPGADIRGGQNFLPTWTTVVLEVEMMASSPQPYANMWAKQAKASAAAMRARSAELIEHAHHADALARDLFECGGVTKERWEQIRDICRANLLQGDKE